MTKQLEINLDFCLFNHMFDENKMISDTFLNDNRSFKIRLVLMYDLYNTLYKSCPHTCEIMPTLN